MRDQLSLGLVDGQHMIFDLVELDATVARKIVRQEEQVVLDVLSALVHF